MDTTLLELFAQTALAEEWVERTKYNVIPWVEKKGKSYWDFVRFYGHYKIGVLKELSRSQFSHLLYSTCKERLDPKDSESSLKYNMDVFPYKDDLKKRTREELKKQPEKKWRFDFLADSHLCNKLLEELDSEYNKPLPQKAKSSYEEIKNKIKAYLVKIADEQRFTKVFDNPTYGRYTPMFSLEVYANKGFMDARNPTYIRSFEYMDGKVDDSKVNELFSRYSSDSRVKLYIVSVQGFDLRTQLVATDHHVSLVLLNPNYEITDDSFITPRSVAIHEIEQRNLQMLQGKREMDVPFVIAYDEGITTSLADVLAYHSVPVKKGYSLEAPYLTDDYIEHQALKLVASQVKDFVDKMHNYPRTRCVPEYHIEPEQMLKDIGYSIFEDNLTEKGQLAVIDMKKKTVTVDIINPYVNSLTRRRRYSLAHELGHAVLHSQLNVASLGESEKTLSHSAFISSNEYQWLERQANLFAACLLMPRDVVGYLYYFYYQIRYQIRDHVEPLYIINNQQSQWNDFFFIASRMAEHLNVSVDALKYRMIKLGLLIIKEEKQKFRDIYQRLNFKKNEVK